FLCSVLYKIKEIESSKPVRKRPKKKDKEEKKKRKSIHAQQYRSMGGATATA
ncbi:hypothetical protein ACJX0J_038702, partial [Zea mays]